MTALPTLGPAAPAQGLERILAAWRRGEPVFFGAGVLFLATLAPLTLAALMDDRLFGGVDIWIKPVKFALALAIYSLTLALYARALPSGLIGRRWYRGYRAAVLGAMAAELAWIAAAAAAGTASHFNAEGAWAVAYPIMGLLATLLTSATLVYAVAIVRDPAPRLPPALRDGLILGLGLTLPLTLVTAGTLSANDGHLVGAAGVTDAGGLPFFGWSREAGDLRVPHFLGTHAMHAVPAFALAWVAAGGARRWPVWAAAAGYAALVAWTFREALAGRPFLPLMG